MNYTTAEVSKLCHVSLRQLQWWDERGILTPSREGRLRLYSVEQLHQVRMIERLRKKGITLRHACKIIRSMDGTHGPLPAHGRQAKALGRHTRGCDRHHGRLRWPAGAGGLGGEEVRQCWAGQGKARRG